MVTESDTVYIQYNDSITLLGTGFESKEDIVQTIKEQYEDQIRNDVTITFGTCDFSKISDTDTEEISYPRPVTRVPLSEVEKKQLESIINDGDTDDRVKKAYHVTDKFQNTRSLQNYGNMIRYQHAIDLALSLNVDIFEDPPNVNGELITEIQEDFFDTDKISYLGVSTGYAARGRRDPYVIMYGRINRDTKRETQFRQITAHQSVVGHYWNDLNMSPVPIYYNKNLEDNYGFREQDYIIVLNESSPQTDFSDIEDSVLDRAESVKNEIEEKYEYRVDWIGKLIHNHETDQICFGITYQGEEERVAD